MSNITRFFSKYRVSLTVFFLGLGVIVRLGAATFGFTYDVASYEIVAKAVLAGKTVYAETARYNYGPAWFYILGGLYKIALLFPDPLFALRYLVVMLLSVVDIFLFFVLARLFGTRVGYLYYFNPISIIVTGFYSQFDNAALLLGFIAADLLRKDREGNVQRKLAGLCVLGFSLIVKHIFFAFPFWLALRETSIRRKILAVMIPVGIFTLSFLPFLREGYEGVRDNVFLYTSFHNAPLWNAIIPDALKRFVTPNMIFIAALLFGGWFTRRVSLAYALAWYGIILVTFSTAISEQYFVIVLPFISLFPNIWFLLFTVFQSIFVTVMMTGGELYAPMLHMTLDRQVIGFTWQMVFLFLGLTWAVVGRSIRKFTVKQWVIVWCVACCLWFVGYRLPSRREDATVLRIEKALIAQDYELANRLYDETQKNPPFAGSRFWNKLAKSRYYVEYYRNFVKAKDLYAKDASVQSASQVRELLKRMPVNFAFRDEVTRMLVWAASMNETTK